MIRSSGWLMCALCVGLALTSTAVAQGLEVVEDTRYKPSPFNPGDSGLVQRVRLRDHDVDDHPVILTRARIENLGTAGNQELDWIRLALNVGGRRTVLAEGKGFPLVAHLTGPVEERKIPDDGLGFLEVSIRASPGAIDGNTVRTKVTFWYSEGVYGGSAAAVAEHSAVFSTECFTAELLPEATEGAVNPGDVFTALRLEIADDIDNNLHPIYLTDFVVDGPGEPKIAKWILLIGPDSAVAPTVEISSPGPAQLPPAGKLTALPGSSRVLELRGVVGPEPPDMSSVQPSVALTLREGPNSREFTFTAPNAVTIRDAGFEILQNKMLVRPGAVLAREFQEIEHSTVYAKDEDANRTPVTIDAVRVTNRGTADKVAYIEVWDEKDRLLAVGKDWGDIALAQPDGRALRVSDGGDIELRFAFAMGDGLPLGASLLVCKELDVEEIHPSLLTPTRFSGRQTVCDDQAVFFGRPEVWLRNVEPDGDPLQRVVALVGTDGETVKRLEAVLHFDNATCVEVLELSATHPYRVAHSDVHVDRATGQGKLRFSVELTRGGSRPGELLSVAFAYLAPEEDGTCPCGAALIVPTEEQAEAADEDPMSALLPLRLRLGEVRMLDTAGIELPLSLRERELSLELFAQPLPKEADAAPEENPPDDNPQ